MDELVNLLQLHSPELVDVLKVIMVFSLFNLLVDFVKTVIYTFINRR